MTVPAPFEATVLPHPRRARTTVVAEFALPTGSFKDRGAAAVVADAFSRGARRVCLDSSGNAGLAVAAAARRSGLEAIVRVAGISPEKEMLIASTGARIEKFGTRAEAARACASDVGSYDASHVRNPIFREGVATLAAAWARRGHVPDRIVLPLGNGSLLLGLWAGLLRLRDEGAVARLPRLVAVQPDRCAPIARPEAPGDGRTIADGCSVLEPALAAEIRAAIAESRGLAVAVSEDAIAAAWREAWRDGFPIEPTSALAFAGLDALPEDSGTTAVVATGSGLKRAPGAAP
ncbi:MAG TPA: pyridoxal-phosphate dependent enzyme [Thermoanaerobaculia bacterium]|nr:pyridoxal-phosphate dependent enzyme [Thermoanaerobaculia bacterium]